MNDGCGISRVAGGSTAPEFLTGPVVRALVLGHTVVLAMAFPFAVLAARGYSGAPWGRTLELLPVVTAAPMLSSATSFVLEDRQRAGYVGALLRGAPDSASAGRCYRRSCC